jgi:nicotinamidase-related amidase
VTGQVESNGLLRRWQAPFSAEERATYELYRRNRTTEPEWRSAALIVVDATEAFFGARLPTIEAARQRRTACGEPAWQTIPHVLDLLDAFRSARRPVIYTKPRWADESHVGGTTAGSTEQADPDPIMAPIRPMNEFVIEKSKPSAFFGTPLVSYLVRHRVGTLVIVGGTTSGCVRGTALDASSYGLDVIVAEDGCFDRAPLSHAVALFELDVKQATVLASADIVDRMKAGAGQP